MPLKHPQKLNPKYDPNTNNDQYGSRRQYQRAPIFELIYNEDL